MIHDSEMGASRAIKAFELRGYFVLVETGILDVEIEPPGAVADGSPGHRVGQHEH